MSIKTDISGSGFVVVKDGTPASNHTTEREAELEAINLKMSNPQSLVTYHHDYEVTLNIVPVTVHAEVTLDDGTVLSGDFPYGRTRMKTADGKDHWLSVRHYKDGAVRIENGYIGTPSEFHGHVKLVAPDGTVLLDADGVSIMPYASHRVYWYRQPKAKKLDLSKLPSYDMTTKQSKTWTPTATGPNDISPVSPGMPAAGERADLGLTPAWYMPAILEPSDANNAVVRNIADGIGNLQTLVIDPATNDLVRITADNKSISFELPNAAGNPLSAPTKSTADPIVENEAHMPALAILPALLYGTEYDLEQLDVQASYAGLHLNAEYRGYEKVAICTGQIRMQAWALRDVAAAAAILNSDYYMAWLDFTMAKLESVHQNWQIAGLPVLRTHQDGYQNFTALAPWQQDYWMTAINYARKLLVNADAKLADRYTTACKYFSQFVVQRLLDAPHELASSYEIVNRESANGPYVTDWKRALELTYPTDLLTLAENSLELIQKWSNNNTAYRAGDFVGYPWSPTGYPAIMRGAVAAAVDCGADRADDAKATYLAHERADFSTDCKYNFAL